MDLNWMLALLLALAFHSVGCKLKARRLSRNLPINASAATAGYTGSSSMDMSIPLTSGLPPLVQTAVNTANTAKPSPGNLLIETLWESDASFTGPLTTTITLSTVTIMVSAVSNSASTSASTPATTSVPVASHSVTTLLPQRCMQPGGVPLACAQSPDKTIAAPQPVSTLINGSIVVISQKSAAIPRSASNLFKPIVAGMKSVLSAGMNYTKKLSVRTPSICLDRNGNLVACLSFAEQAFPNRTVNSMQKSGAIPISKNNLFNPVVAGLR